MIRFMGSVWMLEFLRDLPVSCNRVLGRMEVMYVYCLLFISLKTATDRGPLTAAVKKLSCRKL